MELWGVGVSWPLHAGLPEALCKTQTPGRGLWRPVSAALWLVEQ